MNRWEKPLLAAAAGTLLVGARHPATVYDVEGYSREGPRTSTTGQTYTRPFVCISGAQELTDYLKTSGHTEIIYRCEHLTALHWRWSET